MQTERLTFRHWQETDADTLYKYACDPEVGPRAGWPPHQSVEESREIIRTVFGGDTMWAIVLKETNEPIGCIGYLPKGSSNNIRLPQQMARNRLRISRPSGTI